MSTTQRSIGASPSTTHCGQHPAGAAARGDAEGVEAGADDTCWRIRARAPRMKLPSGVKLSGPLIICLTPAFSSAGTRAMRLRHVLLEMVPVVVEQLELQVVGHIAGRPGAAGSGS